MRSLSCFNKIWCRFFWRGSFSNFGKPDFQIYRSISRIQVICRKNVPAKRSASASGASILKTSARYRSKRASGVRISAGRLHYCQKEISICNSWRFLASAPQRSICFFIHLSTSYLKYAAEWAAIVCLYVK